MGLEEQMALEQKYVMRTFDRKGVEFTEGRGMMLIDSEGGEYLDFLGGIGVVSLGHCNPALMSALAEQVSKLIHVGNYFYIEQRGEVAEMLSDMLNAGAADGADGADGEIEPWKSFFANSGAEANECAIKLARLFARKQAEEEGRPADEAPRLIVTLQGSFHGRTLATLAATAQPAKQEAFQPLPDGFVSTPFNDVAALEQLFADQGDDICAVMLECVQGESGVHLCTEEFLRAARRLTSELGALLVCDEVQCGCYRTGKPFAFQHFGIVPDVVTIAKGVASGIPCGACSAKAHVADAFEPGDHGTTFGGSNIAMAAAHATLSFMGEEGFGAHVDEVGAHLRDRLAQLEGIAEVRGLGLMVAADLDEGLPPASQVVDDALDAGMVINATGPATLRFLPPLVCEEWDVDGLADGLAQVIGA